ncbi:hypothetical protein ACOME3_001395 [Neoechinorhynchus agilis]
MSPIQISLNEAHRPGISFISHGLGDTIVSCGQDGNLKFWPRSFDGVSKGPDNTVSVSECCTALDVIERKAFVGTEMGAVIVYDIDTHKKLCTFATSKLPATFITHTPLMDQVLIATA